MPNLSVGDDGNPVVIPRPPPSPTYNPGPPPRGSYAGGRTTSGGYPSPPPQPPPDIFSNYPGPETDAAKQLVQQFLSLMGYPTGVDANQLVLQLMQQNLVSNSQAAYSYLFYTGIGGASMDQVRDQHKWAQFGLDAATYQTRVDGIDAIFQSLIGQDPQQFGHDAGTDLQRLYYQALQNNWSQSQIMQKLQIDPKFADLRGTQPWLAAGQTEQQAAQQFSSLYGSAPVDTNALAGWFRFNTGTSSLNRAGREAITSAAPQPSTSETR